MNYDRCILWNELEFQLNIACVTKGSHVEH